MKFKQVVKGAALLLAVAAMVLVGSAFRKPIKPDANYQVTFVNKYWNSLHLQVRAGNNGNPEANPIVQDVTLRKGQSVTVAYDVLCYYRRDADPDRPDNVRFTTWTGTGCSRNAVCVVDNP